MLGRTNTGGGGGGLAFRVYGNPAPTNPKPNDIWVDTNEKITSYIFSVTEPEGYAPGMIWIITGTISSVEFNALKKNGIQVYPISAKQYIGGAWVDKTAKSYQGGAWVDWWNGELYKYGNEYTEHSGGWYMTWRHGFGGFGFKEATSLKSTGGANEYSKTVFSAHNPIDLSSVNTITAVFSKVDNLNTSYTGEYGHAIGLRSSKWPEGEAPQDTILRVDEIFDIAYAVNTNRETDTHSIKLDVSQLNGQAYLSVWFGCISCECFEVFYE